MALKGHLAIYPPATLRSICLHSDPASGRSSRQRQTPYTPASGVRALRTDQNASILRLACRSQYAFAVVFGSRGSGRLGLLGSELAVPDVVDCHHSSFPLGEKTAYIPNQVHLVSWSRICAVSVFEQIRSTRFASAGHDVALIQ